MAIIDREGRKGMSDPKGRSNPNNLKGRSNLNNLSNPNSLNSRNSQNSRSNPSNPNSLNNQNGGFSGDSYKDVEDYLRRQIYDSERRDADLAERERRERRLEPLARIADALGAFGSAYNRARYGVREDAPSMSAKARARYERAREDMDRNRERRLSYVTALGRLRDSAREAQYRDGMLELHRQEEERRRIAADVAVRKQDWTEKYQQGLLDVKKEQQRIDEDYKKGLISVRERDAASRELQAHAAMLRAQNAASGRGGSVGGYTTTTVIDRDPFGRETGRTTTRTPAGGGSSSGGGSSTGGGGSSSRGSGGSSRGGSSSGGSQKKGDFSGFSIHKKK